LRSSSRALALELEAFNVGVKLVEPGYGPPASPATRDRDWRDWFPEAYAPFAQRIFASLTQPAAVATESNVAEAVWHAVNDRSGRLRFPAGPDAVALARSK
jgi:hypothetical protein